MMDGLRNQGDATRREAATPAAQPPAESAPTGDPLARLGDRMSRWLLRGSVIGVAVSLLLHAVILIILAFVQLTPHGGAAGMEEGVIETAVMSEADLNDLMESAVDSQTPALENAELPELPATELDDGDLDAELPGVQEEIGRIADDLGGAGDDLGADGMDLGGAGGGASFFGVEARGSRFAYIVDVSGSMRGEKMNATKIELIESINALLEHMAFHVVFYSSDAYPIGGRRKWIDARDAGKRWALRQVEDINAQGGTEPWPAFAIVLDMRPRPDAIYFMTDGAFDPSIREQIARVNTGSRKIPIHCITFVDRSAAKLMRQIAEDSGGTYSHVEAP